MYQYPTFRLWDMFLNACLVLLNHMRADREAGPGSWKLHLQSTVSMLPYYGLGNKTNYGRWTPWYVLDMLNLPQSAQDAFEEGQFSVRFTEGSFNGTYSDMATERHVKEVKGPGGVTNVTRQEAALVRWSLTRHITGEMTTKLQDMFESASSLKDDALPKKIKHKELNKSSMTRDEKDLNKLITHVKESMINPFDKEELIKHEDVLVQN